MKLSMRALVVAAVFAPALALAQPKTADEWYKEGETQYNLGDFDKAAEAFKQGFQAEADDSKKPAYLYNVAQAYRQGGKCKDAAFFYKRYLVLKDADTVKPLKPEKRAEIEQRIAEQEECAKNQGGTTTGTTGTKPTTTGTTGTTGTKPTTTGTTGTTGTKPTTTGTTGTTKPTTTGTTGTKPTTTGTKPGPTVGQREGEGEGEGEGDGEGEEGMDGDWDANQPKLISARFVMGGAYVGMGDLDVGMRASFGIIGGYPVLRQEKLMVEAGLAFGFTPINYRNNMTDQPSRATLVNLMANGAATYDVMPKLRARGDLGLGIMSFGGLEMGNPFTEGNLGTTGALTMFAFRVGISADYEIMKLAPGGTLVATATPFALTYAPAKEGLREDIGGIMKLEFLVGVGYRM